MSTEIRKLLKSNMRGCMPDINKNKPKQFESKFLKEQNKKTINKSRRIKNSVNNFFSFRTNYSGVNTMNDEIETEVSREPYIDDLVLNKIDNVNQCFVSNNLTSEGCCPNLSDKVIDYLNCNISKLFEEINKKLSDYKRLKLCVGDVNMNVSLRDDEKDSKINRFLQVAIDELADAVENANFSQIILNDGKINVPTHKFSLKLYHFHLPKCVYTEKIKIKCPPIILLLDHTISVIWMLFSNSKKKGKRLAPIHCVWALYFFNFYNENGKKHTCIDYCVQKVEKELERLEKTEFIDHEKYMEDFSRQFIPPNVKQLHCIKKNSIIHEKLIYLQKYDKLDVMGRYILQTLLVNLSNETVDNVNSLTLDEKSEVETILNSSEEMKIKVQEIGNVLMSCDLEKPDRKVNGIFGKLLNSFILLKDMNNGNQSLKRKLSDDTASTNGTNGKKIIYE